MSYDKQDHYYHEAKKDGYRARSAYKLKQIQKKFKNPIRRGHIVVDLGAAPGGWTQVASEYVGTKGKVIAVDKNPIRPFNKPNITTLQMDMRSKQLKQYLINELGRKANIVLSDLAGNTTGTWSLDSERQQYLATLAFEVAQELLVPDGTFITKIFRGPNIKEFEDLIKDHFQSIRHWRPPATRKKSAEEYVICQGFIKEEEKEDDG
ncbi:MAG: RlmE family RNA methyltransferase [Candidatus Heimdallarchaeota archaeon]|nr:RlmE family RNA methyltransferase [Candidatus Heimdallarchaeota archaeon]